MIDSSGGPLYLGIEIGGTKLQVYAGTSRRLVERVRLPVDAGRGAVGIRQQLEQLLPRLADRFHPPAVGIGFGGPVDWRAGRICCSHQVEGWSDFPLASWVSSLIGAPVRVDNDANVAALAEAHSGAGARHSPVFYVTLGSGVGAGLVVDGSIYHGARPGEAEIGHVRLDRSGTRVEDRCSGWAVNRRIRAAVASHPESLLVKSVAAGPGPEASHLGAALAAGDPLALAILRELGEDLAFALSHVIHLFHPEIIVLGGGLSLVGEPLRAAVGEAIPRFTMKAFAPFPKIALAMHGEQVVPMGALALASDRSD